MTQPTYKIAVIADGDSPYIEDTFPMLAEATEAFERMKTATFVNDGRHEFVFDHKDDIIVIDPADKAILAWNRDEERKPSDFDPSKFLYGERQKRLIGWQIVGADGYNIHAEEDDPFGLNSFDILVDEAVETARAWAAENEGYRVVEVYEGDVEEPEFVGRIGNPSVASGMKP